MAGRVHDYERTMAFADIALGQMKALRQPPRARAILKSGTPMRAATTLRAVILPNTMLPAAITVVEHIRRAVMAKELMKRSTGEISVG